MHGYAKEFETILNGNKPASTDDDKAAKPKDGAPSPSSNEGDDGPDRPPEDVQN